MNQISILNFIIILILSVSILVPIKAGWFQIFRGKTRIQDESAAKPSSLAVGPAVDLQNISISMAGLVNAGNTCYANSVLQLLFRCSHFKKAILESSWQKNSIGESMRVLFSRMMDPSASVVDPIELLKRLNINANIQEDAQEFLLGLLHKLDASLEEEGRNSNDSDRITNLFRGKSKQVIRCLDVNFTKERSQDFLDLSVEVSSSSSNDLLSELLESMKPELLDSKYKAGEFGLQTAEKYMQITDMPKVLLITLKRFSFDMDLNAMKKIHNTMEFPFSLNASHFATNSENQMSSLIYDLSSVVIHDGSAHAGHYVCLSKVPPHAAIDSNSRDCTEDHDNWVLANDHAVSHVDEKVVAEMGYGGTAYPMRAALGRQGSKNAYLLLYVRRE